MGYRSQVAGCLSVDSFNSDNEQDRAKFKEMIGFIKLSKFYEVWNNDEHDKNAFGWEEGAFVLYGADWKWYSDYEDVKAWDDLWYQMREIEGISGYFCRVGESIDDIEEKEFGNHPCLDFFYPFSALSFDGDHFLGKRNTDAKEEQAEQAPANP